MPHAPLDRFTLAPAKMSVEFYSGHTPPLRHLKHLVDLFQAPATRPAARYEYTWRRHEGTLNAYLICAGADGSEQAIPLDGLSLRWPPF